MLGQCREPFVVSNTVSRLSISCLILKIFAVRVDVKLRSRRKTTQIGRFGPISTGGDTQNLAHLRTCGEVRLSSVQ